MIEIKIDQKLLDQELERLHGIQHLMDDAVTAALHATAPKVRLEVIGTLEKRITVGSRFIYRAVKYAQYRKGDARFRVFSKSLFLDDYELDPREQTARTGVRSKEWPGFTYKLRRDGKTFHSYGTPTGSDGTGSTPFLARTRGGNLRVMYRRNPERMRQAYNKYDDVFLAYAPPIQYHAVAPEVQDAARDTAMRIFHAELHRAVGVVLKDNPLFAL